MSTIKANWSDRARAESLRVRRQQAAQRRDSAARRRDAIERGQRGSQAAAHAARRPDLDTNSRDDLKLDEDHMIDRNNRLDEINQLIEDEGLEVLNESELAQYLDDLRDLMIHNQSINDTEERFLEEILYGNLDLPFGQNYKGQADPIPAWLDARTGALETVSTLLNTDPDTARQWAEDYEADPAAAGPPPNGGDPAEFHKNLRFHIPLRDIEGIIPADEASAPVDSAEPVQANWSDKARAASLAVRRALGWPGLSKRWNQKDQQSAPRKSEGEQGADQQRPQRIEEVYPISPEMQQWLDYQDQLEFNRQHGTGEEEIKPFRLRQSSNSNTPEGVSQSGGNALSGPEFAAAINEGGFGSDVIGNADESDIAAVIPQLSTVRQDEWFNVVLNDTESLEDAVSNIRQQLETNQPIDDYTGAFLDSLARNGYAGQDDGDPVVQEMERRSMKQNQPAQADVSTDPAFLEELRRRGIDPKRQPGESAAAYMQRLFPND